MSGARKDLPLKDRNKPPVNSPGTPLAAALTIPAQGTQSTSSDTGDQGKTPETPTDKLSYAIVTGDSPNTISILNLDLRPYFTPYNLPSLEQIIHAVQALFPNDEGLRMQQLRGAGTGIYRLLLSKPISDLSGKVVVFKQGNNKQINVQLELQQNRPSQHGSERKEGLLITFLNASAGTAYQIPSTTFDSAMKPYGEVLKATAQQNYKGSTLLNGNRYCVLDNKDKQKVPGSLNLLNPITNKIETIFIRYRGQEWYCRRCADYHIGPCPSLKAFFEAKEKRAAKNIEIKIFSDSTLRCADHVGLEADITCMPGGGVGHIANSIRDDPSMAPIKHVVVVAGVNDLYNKDTSEDEFAYSIHAGLQKIKHEVEKQGKTLLLVDITEDTPPSTDWYDSDAVLRRQLYLTEKIKQISDNKNIRSVMIQKGNIEVEKNHPTEKGVRHILGHIDRAYERDVIWNDSFISNPRMYQGVQTVYSYGCACCHVLGRFGARGLCDGCVGRAVSFRDKDIWDIVTSLVARRELKRKGETGNDDGGSNKKPPLGNHDGGNG